MRTDPDIGKIPTVVITPYYSKLLVGHALIYARSLFRHLLADGVLTACLKYWGRCRENSSQKSGVSNESLAVETNFVLFVFLNAKPIFWCGSVRNYNCWAISLLQYPIREINFVLVTILTEREFTI